MPYASVLKDLSVFICVYPCPTILSASLIRHPASCILYHFHAIATTIPRIIQNGTEIMSPMLSPLKTPSCLKRA